MRMKTLGSFFAALVLCASGIIALSCALGETERQAPTVHQDSGVSAPTPKATAETTKAPGPVVPIPDRPACVQVLYAGHSNWGVPPSLDEQVFRSDAVVLATLRQATAGYEVVLDPGEHIRRKSGCDTGGRAETYEPVMKFHFEVHEYLKGTGPRELVVSYFHSQVFWTPAQALQAVSDKVTRRDERPALLFLLEAAASTNEPPATTLGGFEFTLSNPDSNILWEGGDYTVDSHARVWLPALDVAATRENLGPDEEFITNARVDPPSTVSLSAMRSTIAEMDATLKAGDGIEGYRECIDSMIWDERYYRAVRGPTVIPKWTNVSSGSTAGTKIHREKEGDANYHSWWLDGPDAALFRTFMEDDDSNPGNEYVHGFSAARPMPAGIYAVSYHRQDYRNQPCGYKPEYVYEDWTVRVIGPEGILYEAFFDPTDAGTDELFPTRLTVGGTSTDIRSLRWEDGSVALALDHSVSLRGYALDFIALDGTVSLSLRVADATADGTEGTLSWSVPSQPWESGDRLMLRIRRSESMPISDPTGHRSGDRAALVALYTSADGPNWTSNVNWLSEEPLDSWYGVTADASGRVIELSLWNNRLSGEIPPELGSLSDLGALFLSSNELSGQIPIELGRLSNLIWLDLSRNQLRGPIPPELGNLSNLKYLSLWENQLNGAIPAELGSLSNLRDLWLDRNELSGPIPTELGRLSNLTSLTLARNRLHGALPRSLTKLLKLRRLIFRYNPGLCPPTDNVFHDWLSAVPMVEADFCHLGDRAVLETLYHATGGPNWFISNHWLSDLPLRSWYGVTTDDRGRVTTLDLANNGLSGGIPSELGSLSNLRLLYIYGNQLSGALPRSLMGLSEIEHLLFEGNAGLCAPADVAFQEWLHRIPSRSGGACPSDAP